MNDQMGGKERAAIFTEVFQLANIERMREIEVHRSHVAVVLAAGRTHE